MAGRAELRQTISQSFSLEELDVLCADLGLDPESIPGRERGKDYWIEQVILHFQRRNQLPALIDALKHQRSEVAWDKLAEAVQSAPAETSDAPWWDSIRQPDAPAQPTVAGDVIVANVTGSHNVAVGKNITLNLGAPTPDDKQMIASGLAALGDSIAGSGSQAQIARLQLKLLQGELAKTEANATPDGATITESAGWLLDNMPQAAGAVRSLFALPAVGRVMSRAGDAALLWTKQRFGE